VRDSSLSAKYLSNVVDSARLVDEQAAEEVAACLKNGAMRNRHTELFHRQVRGSYRQNVVARKTREVVEIQASTATLNARIEEEKELRQRSINQQRDYEETLKQLPGEGKNTGSHMSIDLYGQRSTLRGKIAEEKEKRRKSNAIQKVLLHEKQEVTASATGKPAPGSTTSSRVARALTHLPFFFKSQPAALVEASSSGRVSRSSSCRSQPESESIDVASGTFNLKYSQFSKFTYWFDFYLSSRYRDYHKRFSASDNG
jgi:hypothetical protein